ncbi:queuine tRNA-ribosyltransferase family protein [Candidatus Woesearchaeota archaeon]|nr:queuine tRNA-ribosyltransferase family protein [Candidatus Woesearchaeota archaeon]
MLKLKFEDKKARVGIFETRSGKIETPFFMPVATSLNVRLISPKDLDNLNVKAVISNALLLYLRPGLEMVDKFKGIHKLMNFDKIIFTDSGGFQMISEDLLIEINEKKAKFKDPYSGRVVEMNPEKNMEIQERLGSDVAMCLDYMPRYKDSLETIKKSVKLTYEWGKRCKEAHKDNKQKLFFDGYSIGGLAIGESRNELKLAVDSAVKYLPKDKIRYLMGVGSIPEILENIGKGVDCFDSCYATRHARHAVAFTSNGEIRLEKAKHREDFNPIEKNCECEICKNYSRAYIHYLIKIHDYSWKRLVSMHNIKFIQNLLEKAKTEIKENNFEKFKKNYLVRFSGLNSQS